MRCGFGQVFVNRRHDASMDVPLGALPAAAELHYAAPSLIDIGQCLISNCNVPDLVAALHWLMQAQKNSAVASLTGTSDTVPRPVPPRAVTTAAECTNLWSDIDRSVLPVALTSSALTRQF